jgi:predicted transcriptional regulator
MPLRIKDVSLFTVRDVAARLGLADGTVRKYLREGKMAGQKHAGAWHVTEESFRTFLRHKGDDLRPEDVPQLVIQLPIDEEEVSETMREEASLHEDDHSRLEVDELTWLIMEAKRLKAKAHHLEEMYIESDPSGSTE